MLHSCNKITQCCDKCVASQRLLIALIVWVVKMRRFVVDSALVKDALGVFVSVLSNNLAGLNHDAIKLALLRLTFSIQFVGKIGELHKLYGVNQEFNICGGHCEELYEILKELLPEFRSWFLSFNDNRVEIPNCMLSSFVISHQQLQFQH